jgi:hypothetical protein
MVEVKQVIHQLFRFNDRKLTLWQLHRKSLSKTFALCPLPFTFCLHSLSLTVSILSSMPAHTCGTHTAASLHRTMRRLITTSFSKALDSSTDSLRGDL